MRIDKAPRFSTRAFSLDLAVWYYLWRGERRCYHSANCMWSRGEGITRVHQTQLTWHFHTSTLSLSHYHSANCVQILVQCPSNTSRLAQRGSSVVPISTASSAQRVARGFFLLLLAVCNTWLSPGPRPINYDLQFVQMLLIHSSAAQMGLLQLLFWNMLSFQEKHSFCVCWQDRQKRTVIVVLQNAVTGWLAGLSMRWSRSWNSISFCFTGVETSWSLDSQIKVHTWARVRMEFH